MNQEEQWLLPDGVEEVLPERARAIEQLRRRALDLYQSWGYELVYPPLSSCASLRPRTRDSPSNA